MPDVNIKYNGSTISFLNTTGAKTVKTGGKFAQHDIIIEYTKPTVQTAIGSFYAVQNGVTIDCGFEPDILFVYNPTPYEEDGEPFSSPLVFDIREIRNNGKNLISAGYIGDGYGTYYTYCGYVTTLTLNGCKIEALQRVSLNGAVHFYDATDGLFSWTAIKLPS